MNWKKSLFLTFVILAGFVMSFVSGYALRDLQTLESNYSLVKEAHQLLMTHSIINLPPNPILEYGMIRGMIASINDPYTTFLEPVAHELQSNDLSGEYGGIGAKLEKNLDGFVLVYPIPNSPAAQAGILDGDRLISVEQLIIKSETPLTEIEAALRGPVGNDVHLEIMRSPDLVSYELIVKRTSFPIPSVTRYLDSDFPWLGIIQVSRIAETTPDEVVDAVAELSLKGATHFVLDLRNNTGGLLDAGIKTTRLFLKEGTIIQQQYKNSPVETYSVETPGELSELPLVIVVNNSTASAAELIAGALQAQGRAPVFGQKTYGKDSLQLIFELSDHSSIYVTAAKWWVPGLNPPIAGNGIEPEYLVNFETSTPKPEIIAISQYLLQTP
jgi:carboxyl-terminal processing protease